jgi:hypothetical protein
MLKAFMLLSIPLLVFSQNLEYTSSLFHHTVEINPYLNKKESPPKTPVINDDQTERSDSTKFSVMIEGELRRPDSIGPGSDESITPGKLWNHLVLADRL